MNKIKIKSVIMCENNISYEYTVEGEWTRFFRIKDCYFAQYSFSVEQLPQSIGVLPLLGNIMPMVWVFDATVYVEEIDKDFFECLQKVKKGYEDMYPALKLGGQVIAEKIVDNKDNNKKVELSTGCLFSGGVDAFSTFFSHYQEKPDILTIWGADISCEDDAGWGNLYKEIKVTAEKFKVGSQFVRSNFRKTINETELNKYIYPLAHDYWWHGFQHGLALLCLAAPFSFQYKKNILYIASSYTPADKCTSASDPTIDNHVKFSDCQVIHDGYEWNRPQKTANIISISNQLKLFPQVHVCWETTTGKNCSHCEKCMRTILGFYAEGADPRLYGFSYSDSQLKSRLFRFMYLNPLFLISETLIPIQTEMKKNKVKLPIPVCKFRDADLYKIERNKFLKLLQSIIRLISKIYKRIKRCFNAQGATGKN